MQNENCIYAIERRGIALLLKAVPSQRTIRQTEKNGVN